jgi:hypothetical protein
MNKYSDFTSRSNKFSGFSLSASQRLVRTQLKLPNLYPSSTEFSLSPDPIPNILNSTHSRDSLFGISPLSHHQNLEYKKFSEDFRSPEKKTIPKADSPQLRDFSSILSQIDQVVSPRVKSQFFILTEDEALLESQSAGLPLFYKCYIKGKKPPLSVKIKKYLGRPTVYVSFSDSHPRPQSYEKVFYKNIFDVSDRAFEFKSDFAYFGIFCESDCKYKIEVSFGKHVSLNDLRKAKFSVEQTPKEELEKVKERRLKRLQEKNYDKNFVEANKDVKGLVEHLRTKDQLASVDWLTKRNEIVSRKKLFIQAKKNKAIENLNRQARRLEREEQAQLDLLKQESMKKFQKCLLSLIVLLQSTSEIQSRVHFKRSSILRRITVNVKASKIQKCVKAKFQLPAHKSALLIAVNSFNFYRFSTIDMTKKSTSRVLMKTIISKAGNNLLVHKIGNFGLRILKIQRAFRRYLEKRRKRIRRMNELFTRAIEKIVFSAKKKKHRKSSAAIIGIVPNATKTRVLSDYYLTCVQRFSGRLRLFRSALNEDSIFKTSPEAPSFKFMPSDESMNALIEKVIK